MGNTRSRPGHPTVGGGDERRQQDLAMPSTAGSTASSWMIPHGVGRTMGLGLAVGIGMAVAVLALLGPAAASFSEVDVPRNAGRWETVSIETFGSELDAGWRVTDTSDLDGGEYLWGLDTFTYTSPITAAWCMGGAGEASEVYTDNMDTWLVYGPISLTEALDAYVQFAWWLDTGGAASAASGPLGIQALGQVSSAPEEGDWLGWCVLTEEDSLDDASCTYVSGSAGQWTRGSISLSNHLSTPSGVSEKIWIAFRFVSDDDGMTSRGAFLDDVELRVKKGYRVMLPLIQRQLAAERVNLLTNGDFGAEWEGSHRFLWVPDDGEPYQTEVGNIFTPEGWLVWSRVGDQHALIEAGDAWDGEHGGDPYRVVSPPKAVKMFKTAAPWQGGLLQQVSAVPGQTYSLTVMAHAWSNHDDADAIPGHKDCVGDPRCSWGVGTGGYFALEGEAPPLTGDPWNDAVQNFTFWVGIDPTGGTDPTAGTVVWGPGAHIYNEHYEVPVVESQALSDTITVFTKADARWGFRNNDAYWDDAELFAIGEAPEPTPEPSPEPTSEPTPEPTPEPVEWNYPVIDRGSKIGVHAIRANRVGDFGTELVDAGARFPVVKAVDDLGWLPGIKDISPETIVIGRVWSPLEGCPNVEKPETDIDEMANALLSYILNKITVDPVSCAAVDYWEVVNEPDPPGSEGYRRLAELQIKCMEKAEEHGLKLALFSLNAGTPEWDEMEAMVETGVFARAREGGHILALHEGTFTSHDPTECWPWFDDPFPEVEGAGCLNFRYRFLYHLMKQRGEVVPLVVSEWYCGDEKSASTETLVDAVKWYDGEASKDYYFWAACPFTLGPTSAWQHTDYERVYEGGLVDNMIEVRDRQNAAPPAPPETDSLLPRLRRR